jgi:hypothetical protein
MNHLGLHCGLLHNVAILLLGIFDALQSRLTVRTWFSVADSLIFRVDFKFLTILKSNIATSQSCTIENAEVLFTRRFSEEIFFENYALRKEIIKCYFLFDFESAELTRFFFLHVSAFLFYSWAPPKQRTWSPRPPKTTFRKNDVDRWRLAMV